MGVESWVEAPAAGKRSAKRNRVLLAARVTCGPVELDVRLRDLSRKGALVEGDSVPPAGREVTFTRGSLSVPARVAWSAARRAGLEFAYPIDEGDVLAIADACAKFDRKGADAPGDFCDDLNFWHAIAFLLWWQNA